MSEMIAGGCQCGAVRYAVPELHDLMRRALGYLKANPATLRSLEHFEAELARLLGIAEPSVSAVVALARTYHRMPQARTALVSRLG